MMKKNVLAMGLALTMALGLTACGSSSNGSASSGAASGSASQNDASASAPAVDKLVLGTSADYPPFEFHVLQDGEDKIVGIDVFLGEQIAEDMGAEFEVVHMDFNNLFTLLNQGQCDMVIAAAEIDEEGVRPAAADYSDGYYSDLPPKIVVRAGDEGNYTSWRTSAGKAVGAQTATTEGNNRHQVHDWRRSGFHVLCGGPGEQPGVRQVRRPCAGRRCGRPVFGLQLRSGCCGHRHEQLCGTLPRLGR
ncbi:MAG: transporter substrate-binding domain-containing protein [Oscillospiraceae bacterium]